MDKEVNELGEYLRHLRKSLGFTQEYIASFLNVSRQTYSHYETGRITPPSQAILALSRIYGVPSEDLMSLTSSVDAKPLFIPEYAREDKPSWDMDDYILYLNEPVNISRLRYMGETEKRLLYYFSKLDKRDKNDLIDFLMIRSKSGKRSDY